MEIEFKVKEENKDWEDTPVIATLESNNEAEINNLAAVIAHLSQAEVRWNFKGINQGHYVQPEKEPTK